MSRSHSVERDDKPLPPVPPQTLSVVESVSTSATDRARQTLKKMSQDIPTTEYRSPLNIAGRVKNGLSDMTREILVPHAGRATHHRDHSDHKREPEDSLPPESIPPAQPEDRDRERITSSEKIRRQWEESQRSPERQGSSHHHSSSRSHGELHRHKSTTAPPTAFRSEGFPWGFGSREHGQTSRSNSFRSKHRRERSEETPPQDEIYERSDGSGHSSDRLEIHNATPIYEGDEMKLRGRPSLGTRFRTSLQRLGVGATRPAQHRTDISRSPSPNGSRRSPSPEFWRKRSPHSSIRATEQYNTPRPAGIPDTLPRIESQKIDWEQPINRDTQSPSRPPDDAIPTIPDLVTPGIHHEHGPRGVPILEPTKPRPVEAPEHPPSHHIEASQATSTTAVNPPAPDDEYRDTMGDRPVLHNYDGPYHTHESYPEGPGRLKRLLSLNSKPIPVPIEGDDNGPAHTTYASPPRPKVYNATPAGIIRSTSLIRTRSRRKDSTKRKERRVDPDLHVGYESDPWGEGQEILRDAHGNRVFPEAPKRKMSQKKKPNASGPTKIALPMGQVEEFHSVHSNSPTDPVPLDPVSNDPIMLEGHKRTTSTSTFHTAQSGVTRPGSPTRKLSSQSTQQAKLAAPDMKHDRWRRSRSGAPRRPSETLLTTTSSNGNQYADEAPTMHDQQPLFTEPDHEYEQERPEPRHDLPPIPPLLPAPGRRTPSPLPTSTHRSQSPLPNVTHRSQSPLPNTSRRTPSPLPNVMYRSHSPVPPPPPPAVQIQVTRPTLPQAPIPAPVPVPPAPGPVPGSSRVPVPSQAPPHAPSPDFMRTPAPQATLPAYSGYAPTSAHASPSQGYRPLPEKPPIPQDPVVNAPPPAASAAIERVPWANSPPIRTPPPREPVIHASPEQSPPIRTPRAQTPSIDDRHIHIYPSELPESPEYEDDPRHRPHIDTHAPAGSDMRSPAIDTPYVLPRMPTPTLQSPGVYVQPPSGVTSPTIDHQLSPGDDSPSRSIRIEGEDQPDRLDRLDRLDRPDRPERAERPQTSSMLSSRPMTRQLAALSITDQQQRQLNRQTGSEMSFVTVEPLSKREKLAASVLSISSMPWLRNRTLSRAHPYDSYYHSTQDGDSRYYDRHPRHPTDYYSSPTPPQLPPVGTATTPIAPRPEVGKLPSWYPREQAARAAASTPQERESRGPRIGQEAWGWRSSPHHGIPEENEDVTPSTNMPPWPYASGVVTPGPELPNDLVRGESMMTPPVLPPRPVVRAPEPAGRPSGEKKRVPKYRIEQDERGHPVLVPEPGFEDNRWTVFEIGGVEFKRAPGTEEATRVPQWVPKRLSGLRRPDSHRPPYEHQYSDSPAPIHAPLEGRQHDT